MKVCDLDLLTSNGIANYILFLGTKRYKFQVFCDCPVSLSLPHEAAMLAQSWGSLLCLSVRPSVTHVLCDKTKEHTSDILIPHERVITLVSDINRGWWATSPSTWNLRLPPFEKRRLRPISAYNISTVRASEKCSIIANRKSATRFPRSYRWVRYP